MEKKRMIAAGTLLAALAQHLPALQPAATAADVVSLSQSPAPSPSLIWTAPLDESESDLELIPSVLTAVACDIEMATPSRLTGKLARYGTARDLRQALLDAGLFFFEGTNNHQIIWFVVVTAGVDLHDLKKGVEIIQRHSFGFLTAEYDFAVGPVFGTFIPGHGERYKPA